jgi:tetratricopeptide (TPR) repeat protein
MAESWAAVGRMYGEMGEWEKAVEAYGKALPAYRIERAEALIHVNRQWEAVEALKVAIQEQPGARAMAALSKTYAGMGMWRESHEWAAKALEKDPESREAWKLKEEAARRIR